MWLNIKNFRLPEGLSHKFMGPYAGPFKVLENKLSDTYKLKLPENLRVHPTFDVSLLKLVSHDASRPNREYNSRPPPDLVHNEPEFEVQAVLKSRQLRGRERECRNPTLAKCEDETHTPKVGDLESSKTPEFLEFDSKGKNTSPWGVLGVIGKVLKCRCSKWPRIGHLDIYNPSYGQKKGRESKTGTISGLHFGSPGKKCHLDASATERHREYYREDGGGTSRVRAVVCHVSLS